MNFKDQMTEDMRNVFLNENEFAVPVNIDGIDTQGFLIKNSAVYDEGVITLILSSSVTVSESSRVTIEGKTYSVISYVDEFGQKSVLLGSLL